MTSTVAEPSVVIVDPCIRQTYGHYATYAAACREGLRDVGIESSCWAHRDVEAALAHALEARGVFAHDCWHQFSTVPKVRFVVDPVIAARSFLRDAGRAARSTVGDPVLFAPTVDHRQLLAWALWIHRRGGPRRIVLMLRYSFAHPSGTGWVRAASWVKLALRLLRRAPRGRVRLVTDSARLADEYLALGAEQVTVVPIPHTTVIRKERRDPSAPARLVMLGDARTEKGFAILAQAIELLRSQQRVSGVEFVVQANTQSPVYAGLIPVRERLRAVPGVTVLDRALPADEYDALLASADLVLLPYDRGVYRSRSSGPFAEALAAGIPVVCTADTWMSDQLERYGAGELCTSGDAQSVADAIERAVASLPALTARAASARDAWTAFHSPASFARVMRGLVA